MRTLGQLGQESDPETILQILRGSLDSIEASDSTSTSDSSDRLQELQKQAPMAYLFQLNPDGQMLQREPYQALTRPEKIATDG